MPIRIYALAKELNLDNKVVCDICAKIGITGKGSALASLTDEEAARVKAHLQGARAGRSTATATATRAGDAAGATRAIRREDYIAPGGTLPGKVPVLVGKKAAEKSPELRYPPEPPQPAEGPQQPIEPPPPAEVPQPIEPPKPFEPPTDLPEFRKREPEKIVPELPAKAPEKEKEKEREKPREREKERVPTIKLAPMPVAQAPVGRKAAQEPAPQKPDIRLPLDAILAGKAGTKPLAEHIRKHEEKKAAAAKRRSPREPAPAEQAPAAEAGAGVRQRQRRAPKVATPEEPGGELASTLGGREHRQLKRKRTATVKRRKDDEDDTTVAPVRRKTQLKRTGAKTAAPRRGKIVVHLPCTVREFSEAIGVPARAMLGKLLELGTMANINASIDADTAELLAVELGAEVEIHREVGLEDRVLAALTQDDEDPALLQPRAPVITFLGHVDHGKTSLLDRIIGIDVVSGEKGGITQHIRAYRIEKDGRAIAFVDTPGHEAFTEMRARGANVTDIAVLVVAAEDGVMPQTEEAISHARAAGVPIVVALNKIDLPGSNAQRCYEQLAAADLLPTEWGGDTEVVKTSAITGQGIDELLETLLTVAELHEFKANPDRPAVGTCLESELHEGRGVVAKVLVQRGTLRVGDVVVCGAAFGRVKAMYDTLDANLRHEQAGPSFPVNVTGLSVAPEAGERLYALSDVSQARELAGERAVKSRQRDLAGARPHVTLENLFERLGAADEVQTLCIILRADVRGSIEAIRQELKKLEHPEVQLRILQATVGGITEADVHLADASDAVIIGFNVVPDEAARVLAERRGVQIRRYDIIYQVTEDLRAALEGMLRPEKQERDLGRALVQRTFHISRVGTVAGCRVLAGNIPRDARIRVIRDSRVIGDYGLDSLKREKDDVREVREGFECGMKLAGFNDLKEGDLLEAYKVEEIARTF